MKKKDWAQKSVVQVRNIVEKSKKFHKMEILYSTKGKYKYIKSVATKYSTVFEYIFLAMVGQQG